MKITEKIFDALTGEENIIEREETTQEAIERQETEVRIAEILQVEFEIKIKRASAFAKLKALGLTEEEIATLSV
jgi:hypothetical protein